MELFQLTLKDQVLSLVLRQSMREASLFVLVVSGVCGALIVVNDVSAEWIAALAALPLAAVLWSCYALRCSEHYTFECVGGPRYRYERRTPFGARHVEGALPPAVRAEARWGGVDEDRRLVTLVVDDQPLLTLPDRITTLSLSHQTELVRALNEYFGARTRATE